MVEKTIYDIKIIITCWYKPTPNLVKLNIDGSALTNLGKVGAGDIFRNDQGDLIFAFASPMGEYYE